MACFAAAGLAIANNVASITVRELRGEASVLCVAMLVFMTISSGQFS